MNTEPSRLAQSEQLVAESKAVAEMMIRYGGSFVSNLGEALLHADLHNTRKIKATWPEYWQEYLEAWEQEMDRR